MSLWPWRDGRNWPTLQSSAWELDADLNTLKVFRSEVLGEAHLEYVGPYCCYLRVTILIEMSKIRHHDTLQKPHVFLEANRMTQSKICQHCKHELLRLERNMDPILQSFICVSNSYAQ